MRGKEGEGNERDVRESERVIVCVCVRGRERRRNNVMDIYFERLEREREMNGIGSCFSKKLMKKE